MVKSIPRREASRAYDLEDLETMKGVPRACSAAVMKTKRPIDLEAPAVPGLLVEPSSFGSSHCSCSSMPKRTLTE